APKAITGKFVKGGSTIKFVYDKDIDRGTLPDTQGTDDHGNLPDTMGDDDTSVSAPTVPDVSTSSTGAPSLPSTYESGQGSSALPATGEQTSALAVAVGIALLSLVGVAWNKRRC
ncbi:MAG: LPXTG cell wall anchor domain-containing protein, partial [Streptococcaceae bacterium]|nr:LPXTG cell wall anchor domain-containing protein [Streptococcaceae bacterium]